MTQGKVFSLLHVKQAVQFSHWTPPCALSPHQCCLGGVLLKRGYLGSWMVCPHTLCFFRGVSELKHIFMEENNPHTYSPLLSTGGGNSPSTALWGTQSSYSCKRRERGCLAFPHADRQGWLRKDVSGVWKRSRNMYFPNKLKTSINVFPQ